MKKLLIGLFLLGLMAVSQSGRAAIQEEKKDSDKFLIVQTDGQDAADSLDRISGQYDNGVAPPENTYKSRNQHKSGPFGWEESESKY